MDLRLEPNKNKELIVIRSSSCVIKICETSSVDRFHSCHSAQSNSTNQPREVSPSKSTKNTKNSPRAESKDAGYSEEDAVAVRSPVQSLNEENVDPVEPFGSQLPGNVSITPGVGAVANTHGSEISEHDMLEILIRVLHELKSDSGKVFDKRYHDEKDENAVKVLIKDCFTDIMIRYSTDPASKGNSYNRCQKIISKSIQSLTIECIEIIERAIFKQASSMRKPRGVEENGKSLLVKIVHIIQNELKKSNRVLKIVNTELHEPSFRYIFALLKHFIETASAGFKAFSRINSSRTEVKCSGESGISSEISVSDQKLDECSNRLDRLLEKVSSQPPFQDNRPRVIDCFHCTAKCKEQEILLKTVTRFTEEIKRELINHARALHRRTYSEYENSTGNSNDVSIYSPDVSILDSRPRDVLRESPISPVRKPLPSPSGQAQYQSKEVPVIQDRLYKNPSSPPCSTTAKTGGCTNKHRCSSHVPKQGHIQNHARERHRCPHYITYDDSAGRTSEDVSIYSPNVSITHSQTMDVQGNDVSPKRSPVRKTSTFNQEQKQGKKVPVNDNELYQRTSAMADVHLKTGSPTKNHKSPQRSLKHERFAVHTEWLCSKRERDTKPRSFSHSPTCSRTQKTKERKCSCSPEKQNLLNENDSSSHNHSISTNATGKCRYCNPTKFTNSECSEIEHVTSNHDIVIGSPQIRGPDARFVELNTSPSEINTNKIKSEPNKEHKIVPKEELGLVKKSKPGKDAQGKKNRKAGLNRDQTDNTLEQDDEGIDANNKMEKLKRESEQYGKIQEEKAPQEMSPSRKEDNEENANVDGQKQGKKGSPSKEDKSKKSKAKEPKDQSKITELKEDEKQQKLPSDSTGENEPRDDAIEEKGRKTSPSSKTQINESSGNQEQKPKDETLLIGASRTPDQGNGKAKDPGHCCKSNCNCRNMRENAAREGTSPNTQHTQPTRRDSTNQTDGEHCEQQNKCCQGCNCPKNAIPIFMNGCNCGPQGNNQEGVSAMRPIYQFFANPVPVPCNCKETPHGKEQKEAQTSKPTTPKSGKRVSIEDGTQTSRNQLDKSRSGVSSAPSSSAPSKSALSSSAPSRYPSSAGPSGYTSSSSEPSFHKSNTMAPTTSALGKSQSQLSCTCSMDKDKQVEPCIETQTSKPKLKDACTSDTDCCCPENIEQVFQEFDDKYSEVVKEIKFLIREGYIPLKQQKTREFEVTASRRTPEGYSSKTAKCSCTADSCKRCRGRPGAAFSRSLNSTAYEDGFRDIDECIEHPPPPPYASKDTFIYNELQKDIHDLKELVQKTKFEQCPCCKCCKCEPGSKEKPCPTSNTDKPGSTNDQPRPTESVKSDPHYNESRVNNQTNRRRKSSEAKGPVKETKLQGDSGKEKKKRNSVKDENRLERAQENPSVSPKRQENNKRVSATHRASDSTDSNRGRITAGNGNYPKQSNEPQAGSPRIGTHKNYSTQLESTHKEREVKDEQGQKSQLKDEGNAVPKKPENAKGSSTSPNKQPEAQPYSEAGSVKDHFDGSPPSSKNALPTDQPALNTEPELFGTNYFDKASGKQISPTGPVNSSILKDSKEKSDSKVNLKRVEIDEKLSKPSTSAGIPEARERPEKNGQSTELVVQKTLSNVSFGSRKSASSSRNLVLSEQGALFRSRERLRDFSNFQLTQEDDDERQNAGYSGNKTPGFFSGIFGGKDDKLPPRTESSVSTSSVEKPTPAEPVKDRQPWFFQRIFGDKQPPPKKDDATSLSGDSVDVSSGDSISEICRTLLELEPMPCRFYSTESIPACKGVETYVMVMESETPNLATKDTTYIISDNNTKYSRNKPSNFEEWKLINKHRKSAKPRSTLQSTICVSKGTSPLWKKILSPQEIIRGLCSPYPALGSATRPAELLARESSKILVQTPTKKLVSPLNISRHYARVRFKMPKNRDRRRRSGGDLRGGSSDTVRMRNSTKSTKSPKTVDKEVQVTKWNAMTQTAGPRKFNRTDLPKEIEDQLAKYLGLERTVEDSSLEMSAPSKRKTLKEASTNENTRTNLQEKNTKKTARNKK